MRFSGNKKRICKNRDHQKTERCPSYMAPFVPLRKQELNEECNTIWVTKFNFNASSGNVRANSIIKYHIYKQVISTINIFVRHNISPTICTKHEAQFVNIMWTLIINSDFFSFSVCNINVVNFTSSQDNLVFGFYNTLKTINVK